MRRADFFASTLIIGAALIFATTSQAQSWPHRTVKMIVPNPAGTATDVTARFYADRLSQRWGKPVIVENRPGADALVAVNAFVGARDDHTLMFSFGAPVTLNTVLHAKLSYDPERDLVPIVSASDSFIAFAVTASLDIHSLADLAKRAKAEPESSPGPRRLACRSSASSASSKAPASIWCRSPTRILRRRCRM